MTQSDDLKMPDLHPAAKTIAEFLNIPQYDAIRFIEVARQCGYEFVRNRTPASDNAAALVELRTLDGKTFSDFPTADNEYAQWIMRNRKVIERALGGG